MPTIGPDEIPDPTPTPTPSPAGDSTELARVRDIINDISTQTSILKGEQASYSKLVEHLNEQYEEIATTMVGLDSSERSIARGLKSRLTEQRELILSAEKYLNVQKGITEEQIEQQKILLGIKAAAGKMGLSVEDTDAAIDRAKDDFSRNLISKRITGWTQAAESVGKLIDIDFQSKMAGAMGRGVTLARGGNLGEISQGGAQDLSNKMFGVTGSAMGPLERMEALNKIMAEAPRAATSSAAGMKQLIGTMAAFGATTDQMVSTLIRGTRESNLSTEDIARVYRNSNVIAKDLGLSTLETSARLLDMTQVTRQSGGSIGAAQTVLSAFSKEVMGAGIALSSVEKLGLAQKFASGVFGMPVDKLLGLAMYTSGKAIQSMGPSDIEGGGSLGIARKTFEKISKDVGGSYAEQLVATQKTAQLLGINVNSLHEIRGLQNILKSSNMNQDEATKALEAMTNPALTTAKGIQDLQNTIEPLKSIDNNVKQMLSHFTGIGTMMQRGVETLSLLRMAGVTGSGAAGVFGAALAGAGTAEAATTIRMGLAASRAGRVGATGLALLGGATLAEAAVPLILGSLAIGGTAWALNKGHQILSNK